MRLIMNYLYGVQVLHLLHDAQFPNLSEFQFRLFARGLSKRLPHIPKQAEPVTPVILLALYPFIDMHVKCHVALWASFLYAFFMMARKSNIVPPSKLKFDPQLYLCHGDITVCNAYVKVSMRWSKNNQDRSRVVTVPLPAIPGSPLCPVHAFSLLESTCPCRSSEPAFSFGDGKFLTYSSFVGDFRSLLGKAGFDPQIFSGHSFRRGGATTAFKANIPSEFIQQQGDWRSDCYKRYIDISFDQKLNLCYLLRDYILGIT